MNLSPRGRLTASAFSIGVALGAAVPAHAQPEFPTRPVRMVNPYTPGGSVDLVSRAVAVGLTEIWGQQVIVDNRPGAGTQIGSEIVVRSEPDGYTMLSTSSAIAIIPSMYKSMRFDPARDLSAIILNARSPSLLGINHTLPVKSVKELIAAAKAQPGQIVAASSGVGTTTHLKLEMFKSMAQVDMLHVPYKGGGPAIADLLGGQVKVFFNTPGIFLPHVKSGKVRAIATTGGQRIGSFPDVPTMVEAGVPGFEAYIWYGIYGPKTLPAPLVQRWNTAVNRYLKTTPAQEHFSRIFMEVVGGTPAEFAAYHNSETKRWSTVVAAAGIKPQ